MSTRSTPSSLAEPPPFIAAQFHRAVQVIQSLPKSGPIQSSYEEKLAMYSLFKQVTMGNVQGPRPSMFDPLKRSKWDAWKSKDSLTKEAAMRAYVATLIQVLKRYKDRKQARALIREFEMSASVNAGSSRTSGRAIGDSGVSGWTGVDGSQNVSGYPPTSSSRRSSSSSSSSSSGSSTGSSVASHHPPPTGAAGHISNPTPTPTQHLPDPSLPPPDVSPRRMNPALPRTGASSEDGHARRRRQAGGRPPSASTPILPQDNRATVPGAGSGGSAQRYMPSPLRQQPTTTPVASAFPGPITTAASSSTLLPHSALPPRPSKSSPSADDQAPIHLALQKIQTSLSALHSRLTVLEATTTQLTHTSHPLLTLLFPPSGTGRAVTVRRLIWEILKRTLADALLLAVGISVWVMITRRGAGGAVGGALGRRTEVIEFWKAMGKLVRRKRGGAVGRET